MCWCKICISKVAPRSSSLDFLASSTFDVSIRVIKNASTYVKKMRHGSKKLINIKLSKNNTLSKKKPNYILNQVLT
jgi:hypothetical protein